MSTYQLPFHKKATYKSHDSHFRPHYHSSKTYRNSDKEYSRSRSRSREKSPVRSRYRASHYEKNSNKNYHRDSSHYDHKDNKYKYARENSKPYKYEKYSDNHYKEEDRERSRKHDHKNAKERKTSIEKEKEKEKEREREKEKKKCAEIKERLKNNLKEEQLKKAAAELHLTKQVSDQSYKSIEHLNEMPVYGGKLPFSEASPSTCDQVSDSEPSFVRAFSYFSSGEKGNNLEQTMPDVQFTKIAPNEKKPVQKCEDDEFEMNSDSEDENPRRNKKDKTLPKHVHLGSVSKVQDPRLKLCKKLKIHEKLNLVLDLDETILNSAAFPKNFDIKSLCHIPSEYIKEITNDYDSRRILIVLRPYYKEFLKRISKSFNIFVYSHGRWDYVQKVLEVIDKDEKYIRRDLIFKNTGQVDSRTQKIVANLGLSEREADKTLILDDQRYIWGEAQKKVLASKKFIPLKQFMPEEKYIKYLLFNKEGTGNINVPWSLCGKNDPFGLHAYAEFNILSQATSQLEPLADFLEEISDEYNTRKLLYPREHENLKVESLLERRIRMIIKDWKVFVASSSTGRTKMFQELVQILGGVLVEQMHAQYIFVDQDINDIHKEAIIRHNGLSQPPKLISIHWLTECYFAGSKADLENFYVSTLF